MKAFAFPRRARILQEREFRRAYAKGARMTAFPLRFCALRKAEGPSRLGLAVSRKAGNAVARNRWKRAVREAFRLNAHRLRVPVDLVVSVCYEATAADVARVGEAFERLIASLNAGEPETADQPEAGGQ
jgi:ribonuclease P protein component